MNNPIILGIFSGIATSVIVWITVKLFNEVIIPWYETKTFKGPNISGTWIHHDGHLENNVEYSYEDRLTISQNGYKISGNYTCRNDRLNNVLVTEYELSGQLQDGYVLINYKRKNNVGTGIGSFLLKITGNSDILHGGVSFIELKTTEIICYGNISFQKQL